MKKIIALILALIVGFIAGWQFTVRSSDIYVTDEDICLEDAFGYVWLYE